MSPNERREVSPPHFAATIQRGPGNEKPRGSALVSRRNKVIDLPRHGVACFHIPAAFGSHTPELHFASSVSAGLRNIMIGHVKSPDSPRVWPTSRLLARAIVASGLSVMIAGTALANERPKQMVLISFDGAHDNALWDRSLKLADRTGAKFTYFLSCTFLMSKDEKRAYRAPGHSAGRSNVGFAPDNADVLVRLRHIWSAHRAGHEIGSHGCGHFDGKSWSKSDWLAEFGQFDQALADAWSKLGEKEPEGWAEFAKTDIRGFRAPYLSTGDGLYAALAARGFSYDASGVSQGPVMPDLSKPTARFSLPLIPEGPRGRRIIAMDYNLFARHSHAAETPDTLGEFENRTLEAFRTAFEIGRAHV